ncbi:MAG: hypothetical protein L0Y74_04630, partial [candidate division Zixibacteria bacterium]|nr:hypothetical protein [candidate division Zixibacteria bacterium]
MNRTTKILFSAAAVLVIVLSVCAFLHHHGEGGFGQDCAVCKWTSHLAYLIPAVILGILLQLLSFYLPEVRHYYPQFEFS